MLVNYRPEYSHQWTNKSYYSQLRLDPLGGSDGAAMLAALLGESIELDPLKRLITERTGGNPFFIEEIVQSLFDEGALVRNGEVKVARSLSQLRLPATVQGILAARIDRQPNEHKQLLQTLSVIGRESSLSLLSQVASHVDAQLQQMLTDLQVGEFIYEQPATTGIEYVFKHALTQEVAYNSLLIEHRKQLHERAGLAMESIFASQLDDHLTQLAHHYSLSDNADKAIEYLGRAGQQALQRSSQADAVTSLSAAVDLLQKIPEGSDRIRRELPLQLALGQASIVLKGWAAQEVERAFTRALEICAQLGDPPEVFSALMGLWAMYHVRGLYRPAREQAHELLRRAQSTNNPTLLIMAHYAVGETSLHTGELLLARKHQSSLLSLYDRKRDSTLAFLIGADPKQSALSYAGWTQWFLGYPDQAVESGSQAILAAQAVSHPNSLAAAEFFSTIVRILRREPLLVLENAERVFAFSAEHGLGAWSLFAPLHRGWAMTQLGRYEEGIEQIRQIANVAHAAGADIGRTNTLRWLAEGYAANGRIDEALAIVAEALTAVEEQAERLYEPEIHLLKGELLLRQSQSNAEEAQSCFEYAIEVAHRQSAKSSELRAATSLARLLASHGRRDEARTILAEIYNWFTEGFDTADLKDAKALLEHLNG